jgi:hypothetical protein
LGGTKLPEDKKPAISEHINILKRIDSYIQHEPSHWEFKELIRTIAIEIENNRKLIKDLRERIDELEKKG